MNGLGTGVQYFVMIFEASFNSVFLGIIEEIFFFVPLCKVRHVADSLCSSNLIDREEKCPCKILAFQYSSWLMKVLVCS